MPFHFESQGVPATGAVTIYALLEHLLSLDWTIRSDSDGTTYAFAGGQVTGGGSGANGLGNANAWVRFREPVASGGTREYTAQRGATNLEWRIKSSASAKFGLGSPSATQTPSAADEFMMLGAGTDAAPTFTALFDADGTFKLHTIVEDSITSGWAFAFFTYLLTGSGKTSTMWWSDPIGYGVDIIQGPTVPHILGTLNDAMIDVAGDPPVVTLVSPSLGSPIGRNDALVFDVTDVQSVLADVEVIVKFPSGRWEAAHDGTSWSGQYSTSSVRASIADGYRFTIQRTGGWPQTPTILFRAVDAAGNINS